MFLNSVSMDLTYEPSKIIGGSPWVSSPLLTSIVSFTKHV